TVSDPAVVATGGQSVTAVEGALSASQVVATSTDPTAAHHTHDYTASSHRRDNTLTTGADQITVSGGVFSVYGSHTYAEESAADHPGSNPYDITVTINHESTTPQVVHSSATVSDPAVLPSGGFTIQGTEGVAIRDFFTGLPVLVAQ